VELLDQPRFSLQGANPPLGIDDQAQGMPVLALSEDQHRPLAKMAYLADGYRGTRGLCQCYRLG